MRFVLYAVSSPHASELLETATRLGWEVAAAVRNVPHMPVPPEIERVPVVEADRLDRDLLTLPFAVPLTNPANRYRAVQDALARGFPRTITLVDPTAIRATTATLEDGCYVGAGSVIGAGARLGEACLINRSCSIGHHTEFEAYASTGPGVVVAGSCRIGKWRLPRGRGGARAREPGRGRRARRSRSGGGARHRRRRGGGGKPGAGAQAGRDRP